jgi:SOS response regulatory protein OraA/RecX
MAEIPGEDYEITLNKLASKKADEVKKDRSVISRKSKVYRFLVQKGYERDLVTDIIKTLYDSNK